MKQIFYFVSIALLSMAFGLKLSAQQDCASAVDITSLPYSETGLTTTAMGNNYSSTDACGSTAMDNDEYIFSITPDDDIQINVELSNTELIPAAAALAAKIGLFITAGCPDVGTCVASIDSEAANPSISDIDLIAGTTYYIVISSSSVAFLAPTTNVNFNILVTRNLNYDLGVTSIEGLSSDCGLSNNETIGCYFKNFGLSPQTGFDMSYTINGATAITETFSGTIEPGATEYFEFTTTADLSTIGEYNINVYTNSVNDENALNDSLSMIIVNMPIYSTFPITEDFESGTGYWSTGGTASSWVHGSPDELIPELVINSAHSGDNIWVTNLAGNTNTSEVSYIESPCYDLSSLSFPTIELYAWVNFSLYGNSGNIKASIDGGSTWTIDVYTFANTTEWEYISAMPPELIGETNVRFRINYTSGVLAANGIAIDDFTIKEAILTDVGITDIITPTNSCGLTDTETVSVEITNFGAQAISDIIVDYSIDGGITWLASPETVSTTIEPDGTYNYVFTETCDLSAIGSYDIVAKTVQSGDEDNTNDETTITIVNMPIYSTFPITEDFESGTGYWSTGGTASSWVHGSPDELIPELVINSAHSGDNIWVTNLAGNTNTSEVSYIESPCYDLSSLSFPTIELYAWVNFSLYGNSGNIKASIDGGSTWTIDVYTFANTTEWEYISAMPPELIGETNVRFRINYTSGVLAANGIAIDDFTIKEAILTDVGITDIITPTNSCGLTDTETVSVEITNFGAQAISDIIVDYSIDGGITWLALPETVSTTIQSGSTYNYDFTATCDLSAIGSYDIVAKTVQSGDEDNTNDEYQKTISSQATISALDYEESFESGDGGWHTYGTNSTMELAMPDNTLINSAGDGDYAWVTNATGFNNSNEISYLESPCFDFTDFVHPVIEVMIQYETNMMMSNFSLEYSLDNGVLWDTVKSGEVSQNWYGGALIPIGGTWNGSSAGWQIASTNIPYLINQTSVKFRFVFNNGMFAMEDTEGVAIDLFKISDCTTTPSASFTYNVEGNFVYFTNESENATSYSWNFGDNQLTPSTSTDENPVFNYTAGGSYTVSLTVSNGCSTDTYSTTIDISTSVCETNISSGIYPNPANSQLFINIENTNEFSYQIININGQLMQSGISIDNGAAIDISEMASGVYFIKIENENESFINQFIKE